MIENTNLVIINNEKVFKDSNGYHCENFDLKFLPEVLSINFNVGFIARRATKKGEQKIDLSNIKVASNILTYLYLIFRSFKKKSKYLIISITPYTFFSCLFLFICRKKVYLYLRSDGHDEWKYILGKWSVCIFHIMFRICVSLSEVIVCNRRISKKGHLISISRLDEKWFEEQKEANLKKIKFLYVGRMSPEKGIFDFINMFNKLDFEAELSIAGYPKNSSTVDKRIKFLGYFSNPELLMHVYDDHNITILPSYTEGYPYVIDESLSRRRPVIIFDEISYVKNDKKGIFVAKRNYISLKEKVDYIWKNYTKIQKEIDENKLPTKKSMIRQISNIIKN